MQALYADPDGTPGIPFSAGGGGVYKSCHGAKASVLTAKNHLWQPIRVNALNRFARFENEERPAPPKCLRRPKIDVALRYQFSDSTIKGTGIF